MTKTLKNKLIICGLALVLTVCLALGLFSITLPVNSAYALTEPTTGNYDDEFVVTDTADEVLAEYTFAVINDNECSVRLTNKTAATKAIIPDTAEIDGKEYIVTEVALNGFLSATKLIRVRLPSNIKKIGNMAFANCSALKRVVMANVKEIGNNAFYRCSSLEHLVLPKSVETVGSTILRSNNTAVHVRAESVGQNWAANWNTGNSNEDVEFNSQYAEPLELETIYGAATRSSSPTIIGYAVAGGQPRSDKFYEEQGDNIFLPNLYNDDYILSIQNGAFSDTVCNKLVIEYSSQPLFIGSNAFDFIDCNDIIINRNIKFTDETTGITSDNIFSFSTVKRIVLPDTITELPSGMFTYCMELTNIFFATPQYREKRADVLQIVDDLALQEQSGVVRLTQSPTLTTIKESAFMGTMSIMEMHIYDNIKNIEASIFTDWSSDQKVYIHNENCNISAKNGYNWHPQWYQDIDKDSIVYSAEYYTITFDFSNGTSTKEVKYGAPIGEMPVPHEDYKVFNGWIDETSEIWTEESIYNIKKDLRLVPAYTAFGFIVGYDANKPLEASNPVVGTMQVSYFSAGGGYPLAPIGYSILGWDFDKWCLVIDGIEMTFYDQQVIDIIEVLETFGCPINNGDYISLCALWKVHIYKISYDCISGTNPDGNPESYTIETETITFLPPVLTGYNCYWSPKSIPQGSCKDIVVKAHYIKTTYHTVYFDANGGEYPYVMNIFDEEKDYPLTNPTRNGYSFVGWRVKGTADTFVTNLKGYKDDIKLEAIWVLTGTSYLAQSNTSTLTVVAVNSTVKLPAVHSIIKIIVSASVKQLYIYGESYATHALNISIQGGRTSAIDIVLNNVHIQSFNASVPAICMEDDNPLNLTAYKNCVIQGATGSKGTNGADTEITGRSGGVGGNGGLAVKCAMLNICSSVTIIGGKGGMGGYGCSGVACGDGGAGGNGNYAVDAMYICIGSDNVTICGGKGGDGGRGGSSHASTRYGAGGAAGLGSDAVTANIINAENYSDILLLKGENGVNGPKGDDNFHEITI